MLTCFHISKPGSKEEDPCSCYEYLLLYDLDNKGSEAREYLCMSVPLIHSNIKTLK